MVKRTWLPLPLLALAALLGSVPSRALDDPGAALRRIEGRYVKTVGLTARFSQKEKVAALGRTRESRGTLYLSKPGKMRWDYSGGVNQTIVSDGKVMWIYYPDEKTAYRLALTGETLTRTPLALIFQEKPDLSVFFRAVAATGAGEGMVRIDLAPLQESAEVTSVTLLAKEGDGTVAGTIIRDAFGNQTEIRLSEVSEGPVDDGVFSFQPPGGTRIESGIGGKRP